MPPLGPAGRLVGERPRTPEPVDRHVIGDSLEGTRVIRARHPVGPVGPAVQVRLEIHRRDRPVLRDTGLHLHQHLVPAAVAVEHLFAGEPYLDRPASQLAKLSHHNLMAERVALPAEAAPVGRGDDPDLAGREAKHLGHRPVHVVRRLGAGPDRHPAVGLPVPHRGVLLHRQVGVPFIEEQVFPDQVRPGEPFLQVPELQVHQLVQVPAVGVVVELRGGLRHRLLHVPDRLERLVLHLDQLAGRQGRVLVHRRHRGDRVSDEADDLRAERVLVLGHREDPERRRQVLPGDHRVHSGQRLRLRRIQSSDPGVRVRAPEHLREQHPGQHDIVGEQRPARTLGVGVHLRPGRSHHPEPVPGRRHRRRSALLLSSHAASPGSAPPSRPACGPPPARSPRRS